MSLTTYIPCDALKSYVSQLAISEVAAEAGVEKWTVDMVKMKCIYYDLVGNEMLVENIPSI